MRCYICGYKFRTDQKYPNDRLDHVNKKHPNFDSCFSHQSLRSPHVLMSVAEKPSKTYTFGDKRHDIVVRNKYEHLEHRLSKSCVVSHLESLPDVTPIPSEFLPASYFGQYQESLVVIRKISPEHIPFDLVARMLCQHCGGYSKRRHCPPIIKSPAFWKAYVNRWTACYILVWQSDGRAGWPKSPGGSGQRWGRSLIGVDVALSHFAYGMLGDTARVLRKAGTKVFMSPPGPCIHCRKIGCALPPERCRHPVPGGVSLEAMGVSVIGLLRGLEIPVQQPVLDFLTKVGAIFTKG